MQSRKEIKIVTYNILADYLNSSKFNLVKKKYLDNEYRTKLLSKKIKELLKDNKNTIFCLQEVGPTQLSFLYTWFIKYKYLCISFKGLAIFYPSKFEVISVEVNFIKTLASKFLKKENKLRDLVNNFNHVYIIIQLKSKYFKEFTLCTTHIVSNPKFDNIKILQSYLLAKKLEKFNRVIFCGDFNSKPESKVYQLLSNGVIKYPYYGNLKIKNKFNSSYKLLYDNEINITTHASNINTIEFTETVDYIWITPNIFPTKSSLIITRETINDKYSKDFLPNKSQPSDHFYLSVNLTFL